MKIIQYKYTLRENAYSFLNESLKNVRSAKKESRYWSFALVHIVQSLELLCKHLLLREHPVLIYENIDRKQNNQTVTFLQSIERLKNIASVDIDEKEKLELINTYRIRNQITHYEYDFNNAKFSRIFIRTFEFLTYFHKKHLQEELHNYIDVKLHALEAELIGKFKANRSIEYQGVEMHILNPTDIIEAQKWNGIVFKDNFYIRIPFGSETNTRWPVNMDVCGDCFVLKGQFHTSGCDLEQCPICGNQFIGCECGIEDFVHVE